MKSKYDNPLETKKYFHISVPSPTSGVMILQNLKEHLEQKSSELKLYNVGPNKTTIRNLLNQECGSIRIEDSREGRVLELELGVSSLSTLVDLGEAVNELTCAESNISYLCPECMKNDKISNIKLERYFPAEQQCLMGHQLSPDDEQFFSGIAMNYKSFYCPPHQELLILNGALRIQCRNNSLSFKARICPFREFPSVVSQMEANYLVSKYLCIQPLIIIILELTWSCCGN